MCILAKIQKNSFEFFYKVFRRLIPIILSKKDQLNKFSNKPNSFRCCEIKKFEKDKEINDLKLKDLKAKIQKIMNYFNKADINLYGRYIRSYIMVRPTFCCY